MTDQRIIHVLMVEDQPGDVTMLLRKLHKAETEEYRFLVRHAESIAGAEMVLGTDDKIDLILLDLSLPNSDGISSVHSILRLTPNTPIIVMSGAEDLATAQICVRAGAQSFVAKHMNIPSEFLAREILYAIERSNVTLQERSNNIREVRVLKDPQDRGSAPPPAESDFIAPHLDNIEDTLREVLMRLSKHSFNAFQEVKDLIDRKGVNTSFRNIRSILQLSHWENQKTVTLDELAMKRISSISSSDIKINTAEEADEAINKLMTFPRPDPKRGV